MIYNHYKNIISNNHKEINMFKTIWEDHIRFYFIPRERRLIEPFWHYAKECIKHSAIHVTIFCIVWSGVLYYPIQWLRG